MQEHQFRQMIAKKSAMLETKPGGKTSQQSSSDGDSKMEKVNSSPDESMVNNLADDSDQS